MIGNRANKRVWMFGLAVAFLLIAVFAAQARVERNYRLSSARHLTLVVDSIDYRSDVTRVYGKFIGTPHTSQKLHEAVIENAGKRYVASDIDGVDFNRWFQWEDDGVIPVEIDFPVMAVVNNATLVLTTANGVDRCALSRQ